MVEGGAASFEERADIIRKPQSAEDRGHGPGQRRGEVTLGHHQWDVLRYPVVAPHLQDVLHLARLAVETLPGDVAGLERIVFERDESQVGEPAVRLQVVDEAAHPRRAAARIGPEPEVFVYTLE